MLAIDDFFSEGIISPTYYYNKVADAEYTWAKTTDIEEKLKRTPFSEITLEENTVFLCSGIVPHLNRLKSREDAYRLVFCEDPDTSKTPMPISHIRPLVHMVAGGGACRLQKVTDYEALQNILVVCENFNANESLFENINYGKMASSVSALCILYGLPIYQKAINSDMAYPFISRERANSQYEMDIFLSDQPYYAFSASVFWNELKALYALYLIYRYRHFEDETALNILQANSFFATAVEACASIEGEVIESAIELFIERICKVKPITRRVILPSKDEKMCTQCETIVDVAFHQLLDLIACSNTGGSIALCSVCGSSFVKHHGNAKLCGKCKANKEKIKRSRAKNKKEAATNAEKERE